MITIQLTVTAAAGAPRVPLTIDPAITPSDLRKEAARVTKIPITTIKLIVRGRLVADNDTSSAVTEFKLEDGTVLHCMGKPEETIVPATTTEAASADGVFSVATLGATTASPGPSALGGDPLQAALTVLRASNSPTVYLTAVSTLDKLLVNIIENPLEEKYRSLKVQNPAFQKRLGGLPGGNAAILACGFTIEKAGEEDKYCMAASADKWTTLLETKAAVGRAVTLANGSSASPSTSSIFAAPQVSGSFPSLGMGGMPADSPEMRQAAAQVMANPQMMQSMLQNPMVQSMLRNDPRLAGNPMVAGLLDDLATNPELAARIGQMTADPRMQQLMQNPEQMQQIMGMVNNNQGGGMSQFGMPSIRGTSAASTGNNSGGSNAGGSVSNAGNNGSSDADQTEEEMIAEAIRRSLQDGQGS